MKQNHLCVSDSTVVKSPIAIGSSLVTEHSIQTGTMATVSDISESVPPHHVKNTSSESNLDVIIMESVANICIDDEAQPTTSSEEICEQKLFEGQNEEKMKRVLDAKLKFPDLFAQGFIEDEDEREQCSICLELYTNDNPAIDCECGHQFHLQCAEEWLQRYVISLFDPTSNIQKCQLPGVLAKITSSIHGSTTTSTTKSAFCVLFP
jgi:hypothetical protein